MGPQYLTEMLSYTNYSHTLQLCEPCVNTSLGERAFQRYAPKLWNGMPSSLKECNTLLTFKKHLKTYLFDKAFNAWTLTLCTVIFSRTYFVHLITMIWIFILLWVCCIHQSSAQLNLNYNATINNINIYVYCGCIVSKSSAPRLDFKRYTVLFYNLKYLCYCGCIVSKSSAPRLDFKRYTDYSR